MTLSLTVVSKFVPDADNLEDRIPATVTAPPAITLRVAHTPLMSTLSTVMRPE